MKDEYKILIGAVIVILIVLVGAFALSGSNNGGPTATPTVVPVTATPTAVPGGNGGTTPSANPTVVPTVAPTVVPTPVPSTEPASGVKQTEFGYWITYPPLGPENWSSPKPGPQNTIYFDPTSDTYTIGFERFSVRPAADVVAHVHRQGNPNVSVVATIHEDMNDFVTPESYYGSVDTNGDNISWIAKGEFEMRFDPGVTDQNIYLTLVPFEYESEDGQVSAASSVLASVKLTITGVEGSGFTVGDKNTYTMNVVEKDIVGFEGEDGLVTLGAGSIQSSGDIATTPAPDNSSSDYYYVYLWLYRDGTDDTIPVHFDYVVNSQNGPDLPGDAITFAPLTFVPGQDENTVKVGIKKSVIFDNTHYYNVGLLIADSDDYYTGNGEFDLHINQPPK